MPKHGHCLGKRRKRMLYVLLFKSLFHNGERYKYTSHRKQFVFKRRVSFLLSWAPVLLSIPSPLAPFLLPRLIKIKGKDIFLLLKYQRLILLIWIPFSSCICLPPGEGSLDQFGLWHWNNLSFFQGLLEYWDLAFISGLEGKRKSPWPWQPASVLGEKSSYMTQPDLLRLHFGVGGQWPNYYSVHLRNLTLSQLVMLDKEIWVTGSQ